MTTTYLNPTDTQSYAWWRAGNCTQCGTPSDKAGCFCRYCDSCSQYWLADSRADCDDYGRTPWEDCPECLEPEVTKVINLFAIERTSAGVRARMRFLEEWGQTK